MISIIRNSRDPKIVGTSLPQLGLRERPEELHEAKDFFPKINVPLEFTLFHGAKWTDLLGQRSLGSTYSSLIVSKPFMELLYRLKLCDHKFYEVNVIEERTHRIQLYYWLSLSRYSVIEFIDFDVSEFHYYNMSSGKYGEPIKLDSSSELLSLLKKRTKYPNVLQVKKIFVRKEFSADIFAIPCSPNVYVRSSVATLLVQSKLTGFELTKIEKYFLKFK